MWKSLINKQRFLAVDSEGLCCECVSISVCVNVCEHVCVSVMFPSLN